MYNPLLPGICVGYYLEKVPQILINNLNNDIKLIQDDFSKVAPYNEYLEGHIEHEYTLIPSLDLSNYIKRVCGIYNEQSAAHPSNSIGTYFNNQVRISEHVTDPNYNWEVSYGTDFWVNFQKKYEYNPPHVHTGIFSFVIWNKIPYNRKEEEKLYPGVKGEKNKNGCFCFYHQENHVLIETRIPLDETYENMICVFPSSLTHAVFPFYTSDEYRISVSGNIYLKGS